MPRESRPVPLSSPRRREATVEGVVGPRARVLRALTVPRLAASRRTGSFAAEEVGAEVAPARDSARLLLLQSARGLLLGIST